VICDEVFADLPYAIPAVPPLGACARYPGRAPERDLQLFALPDLKLGWMALSGPGGLAAGDGCAASVLNDASSGASTLVQSLLPRLFACRRRRAGLRARVSTNLDHALARLAGSARLQVQARAGLRLFPALQAEAGGRADGGEALVIALLGRGVLVHPVTSTTHRGASDDRPPGRTAREFAEGIGRLLAGLEPA
jgi:hypothetical protein